MNLKPTGVKEEDRIRIATEILNDKKIKDSTEDIGKSLKFLQAWLFLRFNEKFLAGAGEDTSKQSTAGAVGSSVEDGDSNATAKYSADAEKAGKSQRRRGESAFWAVKLPDDLSSQGEGRLEHG